MTLDQAVDPMRFRTTMGHYPTGVVLVTGLDADGEPVGMVVGSFTSVSLDPPLIAFLPARESQRFQRLRAAASFCVNVLAHDQGELCRTFAGKGGNDFSGIEWSRSPNGAPILHGSVAWIDCTLESISEGGDHYIVLGRVQHLEVVNPVPPLLFFQGGYGRFSPLSFLARVDTDLIAGVRLAEAIRQDMERLAADLEVQVTAMSAVGGDLALVASAAGPGVASRELLGTRIPLRPPLGELYVAWEGPEAAQRWLDLAVGADAYSRGQYEARLQAARERGWSMSLAEPDGPKLTDFLREYSTGQLTPSREREINQAISRAAKLYETVDLLPGERYDVGSIVAPVLDPSGHVQLVLRLSELPPGVDGSQVQAWADRLLAAAAAAGEKIAAATAAG